ncbi:MAG: PQQ-dependent sugar dehydrogenase [Thermomicrobiales bacterium]
MTAPRPRCTFSPVESTSNRREVIGAAAAVSAAISLSRLLPWERVASAQESSADESSALAIGFTSVATGFEKPLFVTHAGDGSGRLFLIEQPGRIQIITDGKTAETPFLDITDRVGSQGNEQGLLGLAFAPDYTTSGAFYVDYTNKDGNTVVSRFTVSDDANTADSSSETVILTQEQPYENHNGGDLVFGADGFLYISFGDGGSQGDPNKNGQNLETWLGKILRIDVSKADGETPYTVPEDNPFTTTDGAKPEIFFYGLRNPWRFSFDRETNDVWIGDVGQNTYEEVDFVAAVDAKTGGQNFGWSIMEGNSCYNAETCDDSGLTHPVFVYSHDEGGCSVTGGYVYRGSAVSSLVGAYLCGDYCSGLIWGIGPDGSGGFSVSTPVESGFAISSFGQDEAGELYVIDQTGGALYRITAG